MNIYLAEFLGTALLIVLGCGVVGNVVLKKSGMQGAGPLHITTGWALAVLLPAFIFGATSGAHFNPAVTLALAITGATPWGHVAGYMIAQLVGAFAGAVVVYLLFKDHMDQEPDKANVLGVYSTGPSIANTPRNIFQEAVGTFVLVFAILGIGNVANAGEMGLNFFFVAGIILSVGTSLGGLTGYAINPARDLGPRIAHAVLPLKDKVDSNFNYGLIVPIIGPFLGAVMAALLYMNFPW